MFYKSFFVTLGVTLMGFLINAITARSFGAEGRGILSSVMLIVTLTASISQCGLGQSYIYCHRTHKSWNSLVNLKLSAIFVIVVALILSFLSSSFFDPQVQYLCNIAIVFSGVYSLFLFLNIASQVDSGLSIYNLGRFLYPALSLLVIVILFTINHLTVQYVLILQAVALIVVVSISYIGISRKINNVTADVIIKQERNFTRHLRLGITYHSTTMIGLISTNIDKIYFFMNGSVKDFGIYTIAFSTSRLLGSVQEVISTTLFSKFAGEKDEHMGSVINFSFRISFIPLLMVAALFSIINERFVLLVFGQEFIESALPLTILMFESIIGGASWILAQQFNASGKPGMVLLRQITAVVPVCILLLVINADNLAIKLSLLLLLGAILRLTITIVMIKKVFNATDLRVYPDVADIKNCARFIKSII